MVTVNDLFAALKKADEAGNAEDASQIAEILHGMGFGQRPAPKAPEPEEGDFVRGFKSYAPQLKETLGGLQTLLSAGTKHVLGENAVSDYLLSHGVKNLQEANEEQQKMAKKSDDLEEAWKQGIGTVLTDWLPYQIGSGTANIMEAGATALGGAAIGSLAAPGVGTAAGALEGVVGRALVRQGIKNAAESILEKNLAEGATKAEAKAAAQAYIENQAKKHLEKDELAKLAKSGASTVGQNVGIGAGAVFHGIGETTSRAMQEAGYDPEKIDYSKLGPAAAVHSLADFAAEKIGLGGLHGLPKSTQNILYDVGKGMLATGAKEIPPELLQQAAERYGAGLPLSDKNAIDEYINTAGGAFGMGILPGAVGGARTRLGYQAPQAVEPIRPIQEEQAPVSEPSPEAMSRAAQMPGFTGMPNANQAMAATMRDQQKQRQEKEAAEKEKKVQEIMNTSYAAEPLQNEKIKQEKLAELGILPQIPVEYSLNGVPEQQAPVQQQAPVAATPPSSVATLPGFAGSSNVNATMMDTIRQQKATEAANLEKQRQAQIKKIQETPLGADPLAGSIAKRRALEALGVKEPEKYKPLTQEQWESLTDQQRQERIEAAAANDQTRQFKAAPKYAPRSEEEQADLEQHQKDIAAARDQLKGVNQDLKKTQADSTSLWNTLTGAIHPEDFKELEPPSTKPGMFNKLKGKPMSKRLSDMVADGELNEYLPPDMRITEPGQDESAGVQHIIDMLHSGNTRSFDEEQEIEALNKDKERLQDFIKSAPPVEHANAEAQQFAQREQGQSEAVNVSTDDMIKHAQGMGINTDDIHQNVAMRFQEATPEQFNNAFRQEVESAIRSRNNGESQVLAQAAKGEKTVPGTKEGARIEKELTGKTATQAVQWLINNAPTRFHKFVSQKILNTMQALQKRGVKFEFTVASGGERNAYLFNAQGLVDFRWSPEGTTARIMFNGEPVMANQRGYPSGMDYGTIMHEMLHAVTRTATKYLEANHPVKIELNKLYNKVVEEYNKQARAGTLPEVLHKFYKNMNNALSDPDELISWGLSDKGMQAWLNEIKVGEKQSVMSRIVSLVREVLGIPKNFETALDRLAKTAESIIDIDQDLVAKGLGKQGYSFGKQVQKERAKPQQLSMFSKAAQDLMSEEETKQMQVGQLTQKAKEKLQEKLQTQRPMNKSLYGDLSTEGQAAIQSLFYAPNKTIIDRLEGLRGNFAKYLTQKIFDQYHSIKEISKKGYQQVRLTKSFDGGLSAMLHYGHVFLDDGALNVKQGTKGLIESLKPLGQEVDRFYVWYALGRDMRLPKNKRMQGPRLDALRKEYDKFNKGNMPDGRSRAQVYASVQKDLMALNKSALDVAYQSGTIDKQSYDRFSSDMFFVPFYKKMDDGDVQSINNSSRITNQEFSKAIKGGKEKPFGDLMENTLLNWGHILSASLKNKAATTVLIDASDLGAATPNMRKGFIWKDGKVHSEKTGQVVGNGELAQEYVNKEGETEVKAYTVPSSGKDSVKIQVNGQATYFTIEDPFLLESVGSVTALGPQSRVLDMMRGFKNVLRFGVTMSPAFKASNFIKDTIQSAGLCGTSGADILKALSSSKPGSPTYVAALAGGGVFNYGSTLEGDRSEAIRKLIANGVNPDHILDTPEKIKRQMAAWWHKYEELGNRSENVNRIALYEKLMREGKTHLEASYAARDLMDFSLQGSSGAVRYLTQVVPFLNARLQGLYKIGRDGISPTYRTFYNTVTGKPIDQTDAQKAKSFSTVAMGISLASMALYMAYKDDDDFKKREQWDRDYFWWAKIPGTDIALRIPKPFEFGSFGTLAERSLEQIVDENAEGKRFGESIQRMVSQTFSLNPIPQAFKPLVDIYSNKDSFTNAPIETSGMERLSKQERRTNETSPLAIGLGGISHALSSVTGQGTELSPVQIDYLVHSYFAWLGSAAATTSQYAMMPFNNGVYPDADWTKRMSLGFAAKLPSNQSTYVTDFYQSNQQISEAYADMRHYAAQGQMDKVAEIMKDKGNEIALAKMYDATSKNLANIRKQINRIGDPNYTSLDSEQKKNEINRLRQLMSDVARRAEEIRLARERAS